MLFYPGFMCDRASIWCIDSQQPVLSKEESTDRISHYSEMKIHLMQKDSSVVSREGREEISLLNRARGSRAGHLKNNGHSRERRWRSRQAFARHPAGASDTTAPVRPRSIPGLRVPFEVLP